MMSNLLLDLRLYRRLIAMQLRAQVQYKMNVFIDIATYLSVTGLAFVPVLIYFGSFPSLLGWKVGEVALLFAITSMSFGLAELFGAGIDGCAETIRRGEFDRVLLRPAGALLQVESSDIRLRRLGRITEGLLIFALALGPPPAFIWRPLPLLVPPLSIVSRTL